MSDVSFRRGTLEPLLQTIRKGFQYLCVVAYFWPWSYKTAVRHYLKVGSLVTLLISTITFLFDMSLEWIGTERLHKWFSSDTTSELQGVLSHFSPVKKYVLPALLITAVIYLIWHHYSEIWKPGYEFAFLSQLNRFMRDREANENEEALIPAALKVFHKVFKDSHIQRCSIYTVSNAGLVIPDPYIYPDNVKGYQISLQVGEGVAGRVFTDGLPRYVPRLLFPFTRVGGLLPSIPFPHAVKFESQVKGDTLELGNEALDFDAFKNAYEAEPLFRSFVSVPLKPVGVSQCLGVLNFDFSAVDALDKSGIAMAFVLGKILADEVSRMRNRQSSGKTIGTETEKNLVPQSDTSKEVVPRLGPRLIRMGGVLNTTSGSENPSRGSEDHATRVQDFSSHLTWRKIKAGWSEFKK